MLRKLGSYPRQNGLAVALRELGRIERTLFTLNWLQSTDLRRRVQVGLNKGEAKNALARPSSSIGCACQRGRGPRSVAADASFFWRVFFFVVVSPEGWSIWLRRSFECRE